MKQLLLVAQFLTHNISASSASFPYPPHNSDLVDLGYAKHVPTYINTTISGARVAVYKNIRFANAPTGNLRFRKPDTNLPTQDGVQDGKASVPDSSCISTAPWMVPFPDMNGTTFGVEDCLFLDVYVPEGVAPDDRVPVLQWFAGSAYSFGGKEQFINPMGLFDRIKAAGMDQEMDANIGLFDSLASAEWTAKYIHKFGGDASRFSVIGESAGAGILYYLTTLQNGEADLPFQQAFIASPAAPPRQDVALRQAQVFNMVLYASNCSSIECLRGLSETELKAVNHFLINDTRTEGGGGNFGPGIGFGLAPDGKDFSDIPSQLLLDGKMNCGLKRLIVGSMANEGRYVSSDDDMPAAFPGLAHYRPRVPAQLAWDWTTDVVFACQAYNLANALPDRTNFFINSIGSGAHGQDVLYYFYVNQETTPVDYPELALAYQDKMIDFVYGKQIDWPFFESKKNMYNITGKFVNTTLPKELQDRCDFINSLVLDKQNGA
ncbi:Carboxylesterase, type B [Beauveria brongniartii RCEF 3172]|uniref:Carboxylesterase, type B n=1 Tax=Beauveria brongniartii RCEF 3172 TaxID=1081107 RepID=A0A162I1U8_9HYPO|nr:Carboxylesterase, type B [Beauveria brongniartii RCEF 3172]